MFKIDFADVRPSVGNLLIVGTLASIFILLIKWLSAFVPWDGFRTVVNAI